MKRLNRKGFTLIELMAVIAILVIIMGIALPNITSSIERTKNKEKDKKIELLKSEAELYFDRHADADKTVGIDVSTLISTQDMPGIELNDVCDGEACCIKYDQNEYKYKIINGNC